MRTQTRHPKATACPNCSAQLDASTQMTKGKTPNAGDISVCACCAEILVYEAGLTLRAPDPMELLRIELSPAWREVQRIRAAVRMAMAERKQAEKGKPQP